MISAIGGEKMKNKFYIVASLLIMLFIWWWIVDSNSIISVLGFLFITENEKMNWIGLTGIIAIVGLVYNLYDGRRRFRGDIVSKSRIDWMKKVRTLVATFISDYDLLLFTMNNKNAEKAEIIVGGTNGLATRIKRNYYEILLYVPDNKSNALLLDNIEKLYNFLAEEYTSSISYEKIREIKDLIRKTVSDSSEYFKNEWEIAKKGN